MARRTLIIYPKNRLTHITRSLLRVFLKFLRRQWLCFSFNIATTILIVTLLNTSLASLAGAADLDVTLTVPKVPLSNENSTLNCSPEGTTVGGEISCRIYLEDIQGVPVVNAPVQIVSSRNLDESVDLIYPSIEDTNVEGEADFVITSNIAGDGVLRAMSTSDGSYVGDSFYFRFFPKTPEKPKKPETPKVPIVPETHSSKIISFTDIYSDRTKLTIGKDKAVVSVKVLDQDNMPMSSLVTTLLYDSQYGRSEQQSSLTNHLGIATFTFVPQKKGKVEIGARVSSQIIEKKIILVIEEKTILEQIQESEVAKEIATGLSPVMTTTTAVSLVSIIASILGSAPAAFHALMYIISLILEAFGFKRKKKNWCRVYDSTTGNGVGLALVRLYNQQTMKLVSTIVTNQLGRFNFKPEPGTYTISVSKEGFIFPTKIYAKHNDIKTQQKAIVAYNHYIGQPINVTENNYSLNIDVPIDPMTKNLSFSRRVKIWSGDMFYSFISRLPYFFVPTLILGTLASIFVAIVISERRNIVVAIAYLLFALIYSLVRMIRSAQSGVVIDSEGKPLSGVIVSIFERNYNTLKESQITDRLGRFQISADSGEYILKAKKDGYDFDSENLKEIIKKSRAKNKLSGQTIILKKAEYINLTIIGRKT